MHLLNLSKRSLLVTNRIYLKAIPYDVAEIKSKRKRGRKILSNVIYICIYICARLFWTILLTGL